MEGPKLPRADLNHGPSG